MKRNKTLEVIVSLVFALCLWIYVVTVVTPEDDRTINGIPVVFTGEQELQSSQNLLISNKSTSTVSVKFHGSRADLKRLERNKKDITAVIDSSSFTGEREYSASYEIILPSALQDQSIQIVDRSPRTVQFTLEKLASKTVNVDPQFIGSCAEGYYEGALKSDLDFVVVSGPDALVEKVDSVLAILDGKDVSETFSESVYLVMTDKNGDRIQSQDLRLSETEVTVTQTVLTDKEVPLTIDLVPGGGATEENTEILILPKTATLRGEKSRLDAISTLEIGRLELENIKQNSTISYVIAVPDGTKLIEPADEMVTVSVTFQGLSSRKATVSDIRYEHVEKNAEGLLVRTLTPSIEITLRGPSASLDNLDDEDLIAYVDLTEYTKPGEYPGVPVTIVVPDDAIGVVGEYEVDLVLYVEEKN